jgi:Flp pilus assembly protein TadB
MRGNRQASVGAGVGRSWWSGGSSRGDDRPTAEIDVLVGSLLDASDRAAPTSRVWAEWAARSASAELALVAAAWQLSETTGAPLASAVDRAVGGLLDARARRGKVAVAVAGPRATVTVLTVLPLTGPLFGLACGIDPATLYLGSPIATVCVVSGLLLVWAGRVWCSRMVRRAVRA